MQNEQKWDLQHSVSVKDLIDERIALREKQLLSEIDSDHDSRMKKAVDNLHRRFSTIVGSKVSNRGDVEDWKKIVHARITDSLDCLDHLKVVLDKLELIAPDSIGHCETDLSFKVNGKVTEFKTDLKIFESACQKEMKCRLGVGDAPETASCSSDSSSELTEIISAITKSLADEEDSTTWRGQIHQPEISMSSSLLSAGSRSRAQVDSLKAVVRRLSLHNLNIVFEESLAKDEERILHTISSICDRIYELETSGSSRPDYLTFLKTVLEIVLHEESELVSPIFDGIESYAKTHQMPEKPQISKFVELFFRKYTTDRFRY